MPVDLILQYFPDLNTVQIDQYRRLQQLYSYWNERINLISRKDLDNLYERHILHSLAIAKVIRFPGGCSILDAGTGGGFPGMPLAIMFPDCTFHLVDSTAKKLTAVKAISDALGMENISTSQIRLEDHNGKYDFAVGRALAPLKVITGWIMKNISTPSDRNLKSGLIYLKGGDFDEELKSIQNRYKVYEIREFFSEEFFLTKKIVYIFK